MVFNPATHDCITDRAQLDAIANAPAPKPRFAHINGTDPITMTMEFDDGCVEQWSRRESGTYQLVAYATPKRAW